MAMSMDSVVFLSCPNWDNPVPMCSPPKATSDRSKEPQSKVGQSQGGKSKVGTRPRSPNLSLDIPKRHSIPIWVGTQERNQFQPRAISIPTPERTPPLGWDNPVPTGSPDPAWHRLVCCLVVLSPLESAQHVFHIYPLSLPSNSPILFIKLIHFQRLFSPGLSFLGPIFAKFSSLTF